MVIHKLFTSDTDEVDSDHIDAKAIYDDYPCEDDANTKYVDGDNFPLLMLRYTFLTPRTSDQT